MSGYSKICHLRYCRIVSAESSFEVGFSNINYKLSFNHADFRAGTGLVIEYLDHESLSSDFLLWLSVYVGEDFVKPVQEVDTRFVAQRGNFTMDKAALQQFLNAVEIEDIAYPEGHFLHQSRNLEMGIEALEKQHEHQALPPVPIQTALLGKVGDAWRKTPQMRLGQILSNDQLMAELKTFNKQ